MGEKKHKSRLLALEQLQRANRHIEALERNLDRIWNALGKPVGNGPDRVIPMLNRIYTLTRAETEMKAVQQTLTVDAAEGQPLPPISTEARICDPSNAPAPTEAEAEVKQLRKALGETVRIEATGSPEVRYWEVGWVGPDAVRRFLVAKSPRAAEKAAVTVRAALVRGRPLDLDALRQPEGEEDIMVPTGDAP